MRLPPGAWVRTHITKRTMLCKDRLRDREHYRCIAGRIRSGKIEPARLIGNVHCRVIDLSATMTFDIHEIQRNTICGELGNEPLTRKIIADDNEDLSRIGGM